MAYVDSLEEIGNKKQNLWNGLEMTMNARFAKVNTQIFIKKDLHFYRTDYEVQSDIFLKVNDEYDDKDYIDFRINTKGKSISIIKDKALHLDPANKKDQSFHIFIKRKVVGLDEMVLEAKRKNALRCPSLIKISRDILSIPATGNNNALQVEGKMLELSHAYLEYLHTPLISSPSFLSCEYKIQCIHNAKEILEQNFSKPPTIEALSRKVGINSNQLKVGFKYLFDSTIRQYVIGLRLDHAQNLIRNTQLPLGIICNEVGYVNHGHFSNLYKERFGFIPKFERD